MGYNTAIMILNDAAYLLPEDKSFGERLYRAMQGLALPASVRDRDVSICNHVNACTVISTQHADFTQIVAVGGNYGTLLGVSPGYAHHTDEAKERIVRDLADQLGYELHKKRKR